MPAIVPTATKPEDEELARKRLELAQFQTELADRELFVVTLRTELAAFEQSYIKLVGTRYAELDEIEAKIAEQQARQHPTDEKAQESATRARTQARESRSTIDRQDNEGVKNLPSQGLKALYREVAKRVHPDLSSDVADRELRHKIMAEVNRAYQIGDEARLRQILEEFDSSPDSVKGEGVGAELIRVIRKITQVKRRLGEIESEVRILAGSELAKLKDKSEEYRKQGRDLLAEMAEHVDKKIAMARQRATESAV